MAPRSRELEYAEKRMQQKWYELVTAEQQGASMQVLERMYQTYLLAVDEYNRCSPQQQVDRPSPMPPVPEKKAAPTNGRKKKAS